MRVNTDVLEQQAENFAFQSYHLYELQETVLRIARDLSRESATESFNAPLRAIAREIGQSCQDLGQLRMALRQIALLYERSEHRILDEAEAAAVRNEHTPYFIRRLPDFREWEHWPPVHHDPFLTQLSNDSQE